MRSDRGSVSAVVLLLSNRIFELSILQTGFTQMNYLFSNLFQNCKIENCLLRNPSEKRLITQNQNCLLSRQRAHTFVDL